VCVRNETGTVTNIRLPILTKVISLIRYFILLFILISHSTYGQTKKLRFKDKDIQVSLFPGISSNGLYSGNYYNKFSMNIFGGVSAGNTILEIGGLSNLSLINSSGIQIAGMVNVVGSNTFLNLTVREERDLIKDGFRSDFEGIQLAGLINVARDNLSGFQISGGINMAGRAGIGLQLAGISNSVGKYFIGFQLAGIYNISIDAVDGGQVSLISNYTKGELNGLQIGAINKSKVMKGKNTIPTGNRGFQFGIVNISSNMDGTQIGLINIGRQVRGVQVGLINIFKTAAPKKQGKSGTPIAILNFGNKGTHQRIYTNDLFLTNIEKTTGNCYNCSNTQSGMPFSGSNRIMNQNALIFSYNPFNTKKSKPKWAFGYGFQKVFYNKFSMGKNLWNEKRFYSLGVRFLHINRKEKIEPRLSLLSKVHVEYGKRLGKKSPFYVFGGITFSMYLHKSLDNLENSFEILSKRSNKLTYQIWPGYTFGIHIR